MSTTNYPAALPVLDKNGKVAFTVTHADYVIDGVNKNNPKFFGSIFLNGIAVMTTISTPEGGVTINPLAVDKGGTGYNNLTDLANKIAQLLGYGSGSTTGTVPITKGGTGTTTAAAARTALGAASAALYNVTIPVSWSPNSSGGYLQTVAISGIASTDVPVVGVVLSSDVSAAKLQGAAFANINRITTNAGSITLYCFNSIPSQAITIQLLVVRGF